MVAFIYCLDSLMAGKTHPDTFTGGIIVPVMVGKPPWNLTTYLTKARPRAFV
jgi:hypothetical protein